MKHFLRIYQQLFKINFTNLMVYRMNFFNNVISTVGWGLFQLIWVLLLTAKIKSAYGWKKEELILLTASFVVIIGIFHFFFSRNFEKFSLIINRGELDFLLLKPIDPQLSISFWYINLTNIIRLVIGTTIIFYLLINQGIYPSIINIIGYLILIFFGVSLFYSIWLIFCTIIIWFPNLTNIVDFLYNLNGLSRFPPEMIYELKNFFLLFLLPFTLTVAIPTKALITKTISGNFFQLIIISILLFYLSRRFWLFALRHYTSASS